jgi:hypothetical protein
MVHKKIIIGRTVWLKKRCRKNKSPETSNGNKNHASLIVKHMA